MKFTVATVTATAAVTLLFFASTTLVTADEYHQVEINANCQDVKWNKLSKEEQDFSAKAVMESYNTVHQRLDGGDWHLAKVTWESGGNMLRQGGGYVGFVVLTWFD
jgi:hypothetical protein